jgi:hypothetical protein
LTAPVLIALLALFVACGGVPPPDSDQSAAPTGDLDAAIRETSDYLNKALPKGNKLVILNIQSEFPALSEYIIDELIANTVNDRVFSVVDRQQLDTIRAELDFQTSGEVGDNTAQALGRMAGAQIIVSGAVSRIGDLYRLRVRALSVESAQIVGQFNRNIPDGPTISALAQSRATGYGDGTVAARATSAAPGGTVVPASTTGTASATPELASIPAVPTTYKIGDTGPAGGLIFYDKGNSSGGWRYLEAAPEETEQIAKWSNNFEFIGTGATGIGAGKKNTETIMKYQHNNGVLCMAAQVCDALVLGGFDDWFLPNRGELMLMYTNLKLNGLGGFKEVGYWSSSEVDRWNAYQQGFSSGNQRSWSKEEAMSVRAIRQF